MNKKWYSDSANNSNSFHVGSISEFTKAWLLWVLVAALSLALSAERRDYSLVVVCELLTVVASLAMMHGLQGMQASVVAIHGLQEHRLSSCGIRA